MKERKLNRDVEIIAEVFCKKLLKFLKIHRKTHVLESLFNKVASLDQF